MSGFNGDYASHKFGYETTVVEVVRRIAWEMEAEGLATKSGHIAVAQGHALTRAAYTELLEKKEKK